MMIGMVFVMVVAMVVEEVTVEAAVGVLFSTQKNTSSKLNLQLHVKPTGSIS